MKRMSSWSLLRQVLAWLACGPIAFGGSTATELAVDAAGRWVVGQCRRATIDGSCYWTSQPGAMRVYERSSGSLRVMHKLYSSRELAINDLGRLELDRPDDWMADPARWVDLNAPVATDQGLTYPIVDPRAEAEGFSFEPAAVGNPLPLPVEWMYVTRDGTLGWLDADRRFVPLVNPRTARPMVASEANPIVARVAWWADDTACKINVNTASEGVFWDTPRCDTDEERGYGRFQPARGEWQRDMGHPAAVCLSSVLFPGRRLHLPGTTSTLEPLPLDLARAVWRAAPGIPDAGSLGGTVVVNPGHAGAVEEVVADRFEDALELAESDLLPPEARARAGHSTFFLTARSRAPDYSLAGAPRVSLWPIGSPEWLPVLAGQSIPSPDTITEFDSLMAEASTFYNGGIPNPMVVIRQNARSQFEDLYDLEPGGRLGVGKNRQLFFYLQNRVREAGSGWSAKYGNLASDDSAAMAGMSVEFIRETNASDPWLDSGARFVPQSDPLPGAGQVTPLTFVGSRATHDFQWWTGSMFPRGMGRFPTVSEVALVVSLRRRTLAGDPPTGFYGANQGLAESRGSGFNHYEIEVSLLLEGFAPAQVSGNLIPSVSFTLAGYSGSTLSQRVGNEINLGGVTLNGHPLVFAVNDAARSTAVALRAADGRPAGWTAGGGNLGPRITRDVISFKPILFSQSPGDPVPTLAFSGTGQVSPYDHWRILVQDSPTPIPASQRLTDAETLIQSIPVAFPSIEAGQPLPFDDPAPVPMRDQPDDRMIRARGSGSLLGPQGLIHQGDIVFSLIPNHGDLRLFAARRSIPPVRHPSINSETWHPFVGHPNYGRRAVAHALTEPTAHATRSLRLESWYTGVLPAGEEDHGYFNGAVPSPPDAPLLMRAPETAYFPDFPMKPWSIMETVSVGETPGQSALWRRSGDIFNLTRYDLRQAGEDVWWVRGVASPDTTGDFDNGIAGTLDGPYLNAPDPGDARAWASGGTPYFDALESRWVENPGTYSPYRQVPSSMMLGSVPTGVASNVPWQTLLFRPDPFSGSPKAHYGVERTPDHHLADLFRMPIVKPSEPVDWAHPDAAWKPSDAVSTEGRINMNCELVPFAHVRRTTGLHAVLKAQKLLAIPDEAGPTYKTGAGAQPWRRHIDPDQTLRQWEAKFADGDVFRASSEIAEMWLVPEGATLEQMPSFWARHRLTGDNSKERPYANIYPHLTTRSLTFDLHIVVEEIEKAQSTPPNQFVPGVDVIAGRDQRTLPLTGRIDPRDPGMPDYLWDDRLALSFPRLDSFIEWSLPGLQPLATTAPLIERPVVEWIPELRGGRLTMRWTAEPDQVCLLESSSNLTHWSPRGRFRTGEHRDFTSGVSRSLSDAHQASVGLFVPEGSHTLFVRLRWENPRTPE